MYHFIVNPSSRSGKGRALWKNIEKQLKLEHIKYKAYFTKYEFHAKKLATEICNDKSEKTIVALGGDGTVNEVLNGITDFIHTKFGYIPTGSSNDFARGHGLPTNTREALNCIIHNKVCKEVDVGVLEYDKNIQKFGVSSGIGFDASITSEAYSSPIKDFLNKIHLGFLTYFVIAVKQLIFYKPNTMKVTFDDKDTRVLENCYFIAGMNEACEGGGLRLAPDADAADGYLDVFMAHDINKATFVTVLPLAFFGKHTFLKGAEIVRCKKVHIETNISRPVHTDGEGCHNQTSITMSIQKEKLRLCTSYK